MGLIPGEYSAGDGIILMKLKLPRAGPHTRIDERAQTKAEKLTLLAPKKLKNSFLDPGGRPV